MKLKEFKKGDIIHRTAPVTIDKAPSFMFLSSGNDRSFIESPVEFIEIKSGLIFYKYINVISLKDEVSYVGLDRFDDGNWDYFPTEYLKKPSVKKS